MGIAAPEIVVAGHICLDIIPKMFDDQAETTCLFQPGRLTRVGSAAVSPGGCVANTGLALHRLGASTRLMGKLGGDLLGKLLLESLSQYCPHLTEGMVVAPDEETSYTIVLNPPGVDRSFLHCAGANDTYSADEFVLDRVAEGRILHFGYPPLMNQVISDGGAALASLFREVQNRGVLISLDMAMPDTAADDQATDWRSWLAKVLTHVDLFLPSFDEILFMIDPPLFTKLDKAAGDRNLADLADIALLERITSELVELGVPIVVIKMGDRGLYLRSDMRTSQMLSDRAAWKNFRWPVWDDVQALCPCFDVEVRGTTGAGDCTIAGFLMALLRGYGPKHALRAATAVGALCVQSFDATSGIPNWTAISQMVSNSIAQQQLRMALPGWNACAKTGVFHKSATL